jgi:hypothetical protein
MRRNKNSQEKRVDSFVDTANRRTTMALNKILEWADVITAENLRNGDIHEKAFKHSLHHMQEVLGRFSNSKRLQTLYDEIKGIESFPNENIRLLLLTFYYDGMDLLEKAKKREENSEE